MPQSTTAQLSQGKHIVAVRASDLHYSYAGKKGTLEALRGLSFEAPLGKITGILGPNGSGKSTTFKILSTQILPSQGEAWVQGVSVVCERDQARHELGVTFQSPSLDPQLSVEENLEIHAALFGLNAEDSVKRIEELLKLFEIVDRRKSRIKELSGGLARRVELAKSLLNRPRVLLLDEPTTGLDPKLRAEFWRQLRSLRDSGMSILVTTHLMDEADMCDQLLFLNEGKIAAAGTPLELKKEFGADVLTVEMVPGAKLPDAAWIASQFGAKSRFTESLGRMRLETPEPQVAIRVLSEKLGNEISRLEWGKPSLADVYFSKTGKSL